MQKVRMWKYGIPLILVGIIIGLIIAGGLNITSVLPAKSSTPVSTQPENSDNNDDQSFTSAEILNAISNAFANVAEKVNPSVVTIFTETHVKAPSVAPFSSPFEEFFGPDFFKRFFEMPAPGQEYVQRGLGSGVIVRSDGIILTNNHVVEGADDIRIRLIDGREFEAEIKGRDPKTDLAVLTIDAKDLPAITMGNSDKLRVGEWVLAIGSPLQPQFAHTVTAGIVSAKGRSGVGLTQYEDYIQTDAAINPGNSGGALVNIKGELVGINSAIATKTGGFMGIGFAIPVNLARKVMTDILEKGRVIRGWLGVYIQNINKDLAKSLGLEKPEGVIVTQVQKDSPAEEAGLEEGDVIIGFNGKKVRNNTELSTWVAGAGPGAKVTLTILRDGKKKEIKVKLGELPEEEQVAVVPAKKGVFEKIGIEVSNITPNLRQKFNLSKKVKGVVITGIRRGSKAERVGLQIGDVILKVNREPVENVKEFQKMMKKLKPGDSVAFYILRDKNRLFVAFSIPKD